MSDPKREGGFSEWVVYVDESGDHGIAQIDASFPVFVLAFVLFRQSAYINRFVPPLSALKFRLFGHDGVVLHERDIRKDSGAFAVLRSREKKDQFLEEINQIVDRAPFEVLASVHDKRKLRDRGASIEHLYHEAIRFGLEGLHERLYQRATTSGITHVVCEARGPKEDRDLEAAFRRVCGGDNTHGCALPFEVVITDKRANSAGLQLADLIARPIGTHVLRPTQPNRAFALIQEKLMVGPSGELGWGLRCFP